MDENKLKVLRDLPYKIQPCCGLCENAWFASKDNDWGQCDAHQYEHRKHTDSRRHLSVNRYGSCPKFKAMFPEDLGAFREFLDVPR